MSFEPPAPKDAHDRQLLNDVQEHGWHVVGIPDEDGTPGWCFTVGLQANYSHPELVIFGLPVGTAHTLLNLAGEAIKDGRIFETDVPYDEFLNGFDCVFRPVRERWHEPFLGYARWFYGDTEFDVAQMFWPNRQGALPWHEEADTWLRANQPQLFEEDAGRAGVVALLASMEDE